MSSITPKGNSSMGIFTGLIVEIGEVVRMDRRSDGAHLRVAARSVLEGTRIGDSISINGVDLTVVTMDSTGFTADVSLETLKRSTLGELHSGSPVNLERALALGERFGGHMVQGHVDGVGKVLSVSPEGNAYRVRLEFPSELARYIAMKGSITVDGISLTVAGLGEDWLELAIIPHTWDHTTMRHYRPGTRVNLEVDVLAKYVERLLGDRVATPVGGRLTIERLVEQGYSLD
ncbi:MAG TPA: riboflavin synthase [Blastocatellia bacterium]